MKIIEIFDPAMCCSTGLCGPSVSPELLRISTVIDFLKRQGIEVKRYNLKDEPQAYIDNIEVNKNITEKGIDALPITLLDGEIVNMKEYPTNHQISEWTGIIFDSINE